MIVSHILYPVEVLGPGKRIGIWVCGCSRHCEECIAPEMQQWDMSKNITHVQLAGIVKEMVGRYSVDGITISGGEPFEQAKELEGFLKELKGVVDDILVFSGYRLQELQTFSDGSAILEEIAVLVDGEYRKEENQGHPLRGSENQEIHYLKAEYAPLYTRYIEEMQGKKLVQNFTVGDGVFTVGIHSGGLRKEITRYLEE